MFTSKKTGKSIDIGDRILDPLDNERRTVSHFSKDGQSVFMEDGGVMGIDECIDILLPGEIDKSMNSIRIDPITRTSYNTNECAVFLNDTRVDTLLWYETKWYWYLKDKGQKIVNEGITDHWFDLNVARKEITKRAPS